MKNLSSVRISFVLVAIFCFLAAAPAMTFAAPDTPSAETATRGKEDQTSHAGATEEARQPVAAEEQKSAQVSPEEAEKQKQEEEAARKAQERKRKEEAELAEKQARAKEAEEKRKEAEEAAKNDPWKEIWAGTRTMVENVTKDAQKFSRNFASETGVLDQIQPQEETIRRLLVLANNSKRWPNALESVSRSLAVSAGAVQGIVNSASAGLAEAAKLLTRMNHTAESMPQDLAASKNDEIREYMTQMTNARFLLVAVITRYTSALAPANALIERVNNTRTDIEEQLPERWKEYYLQAPVQWLSAETWTTVPKQFSFFGMGMKLRKSVELPVTSSQWQMAITRFILSILLLGLLGTIIVHKLLKENSETLQHILRWSLPWNVLGLSLLVSSLSPSLEFYRLFLALGNLCLIMGQVTLGWDLRRLKFPDIEVKSSPLWHLVPLSICAYLLIYIPLPRLVALLGWLICCIVNLLVRRYRKYGDLGPMQVELIFRDIEPFILWTCLLLCILGLHIYSMILYLLYSSICIATELSIGSMWFISKINEKLPKEGTKAFLSSIIIALTAPGILILTLLAVSLWLATLPGGIYMLQYYVFQNVNIGESQLNIANFLLIITAFFLARTIASMGKTFINKLPTQPGLSLDASLVTPMQTAFTYLVWGSFGLIVLRAVGMNLSSLAVIAGGLSVGIGFGMQNIVNNFISGLILIFSRALQVGDVVEVGAIKGRIKQITVRATVVETYDSATIYVPNSEFISGKLTNWTRNNRSARADLSVGVAYGSPPDKVQKLLLEIAAKDSDILAFPKPSVLFTNFGDSTLDFILRYWVKDFDLINSTASRLHFAIEKRFREADIEIAFPQMDVHVKELPYQAAHQANRVRPSGISTLSAAKRPNISRKRRGASPSPLNRRRQGGTHDSQSQ